MAECEVNMRKNKKRNPEKLLSIIVTGALVCALAVGVISVANSTKDGTANIVDLNETKAGQAENIYNNEADNKENNADTKKNNYVKNEKESAPADDKSLTTVPAKEEAELPTKRSAGEVAADSDDSVRAKYSFGENDTLKWPVKGDIVMKFSMDSTVFFETLGLYKVNPAVNISAPVGTNVLAAASGVVTSVTQSEETGTTVSISIGNDYVTTYGLLDGVNLKKGMTVVAGDVIGKVAEPSKYYTKEGSNLYFKLTKADAPVDPMVYFE